MAVVFACGGGSSTSSTSPSPSQAPRTALPTSASPSVQPSPTPSAPATNGSPGPCRYAGADPDPDCTPGADAPAVTSQNLQSTICRAGYANSVRPLTSYTNPMKVLLLGAYGDTAPAAAYELDHLVPLEVGGEPRSPLNLWPEPWENDASHPQGFAPVGQGAQTKDKVENELHRRVCLPASNPDHMDLAVAQMDIAKDWHAEAQRLHLIP